MQTVMQTVNQPVTQNIVQNIIQNTVQKIIIQMSFITLAVFIFGVTAVQAQESQPLATSQIKYTSGDGAAVLTRTSGLLKSLFARYKPVASGGSTITSGPTLTGTEQAPTLQVSVRDCVLFICKTITLQADITSREVSGPCQRNLVLTGNLTKSSELLSNVYDSLDVAICLNPGGTNESVLEVSATAHEAKTYEEGSVQSTVLKVMTDQAPHMIEALKEQLGADGAQLE